MEFSQSHHNNNIVESRDERVRVIVREWRGLSGITAAYTYMSVMIGLDKVKRAKRRAKKRAKRSLPKSGFITCLLAGIFLPQKRAKRSAGEKKGEKKGVMKRSH